MVFSKSFVRYFEIFKATFQGDSHKTLVQKARIFKMAYEPFEKDLEYLDNLTTYNNWGITIFLGCQFFTEKWKFLFSGENTKIRSRKSDPENPILKIPILRPLKSIFLKNVRIYLPKPQWTANERIITEQFLQISVWNGFGKYFLKKNGL